MNIFYLHPDPKTCARQHCDKHVRKMIIECAQMLSTAHHVLDAELLIKRGPDSLTSLIHKNIYKKTHVNHPCSKWVRESNRNYQWLFSLFRFLLLEYSYRFGKRHATNKLFPLLIFQPTKIPITKRITKRPVCVKEAHEDLNALQAYHFYYKTEKRKIAKWSHRPVPGWFDK